MGKRTSKFLNKLRWCLTMTIVYTQKEVGFAVATDASRKDATFVKVAKTTDIPVGEMKRFEVNKLSV